MALLYDQGKHYTFLNMATIIRTLCYSGGGKSLLHAIGENKRMFPSCISQNLQNLDSAACHHISLVQLESGKSTTIPNIHLKINDMKPKKFKHWWQEIAMTDDRKRGLSRGGIILSIANKEGGAHFDEKVDEIYDDLARVNGLRIFHHNGADWNDFGIKPIQDTVRQIAHEIILGMENWIKARRCGWIYKLIVPKIRGYAIAPGIMLHTISTEEFEAGQR